MAATAMPASEKSPWSQDRLDLAERLWADGYKARFVAEQCGVTRNALLGMAHRKGWVRGVAVAEKPKRPKRAATSKPRPAKPRPARIVPRKVPGRVRLVDLDQPYPHKSCRWPVEGTGVATWFCGKPQDQTPPETSYCLEHRLASSGHGGWP